MIFTGRHQGVAESVKSYLTSKVERSIRNIPKVNSVHLIIDSERFEHKVEVLIHLNHMSVQAEATSEDIVASVDKVVDKLQRQLKKYKEKIQDHRTKEKELRLKQGGSIADEIDEEVKKPPRLIRVKKIAAKPMDPAEAMMQLNLSDEIFWVFHNAQTNDVNVIYKKKDGNFGLIEPQSGEKKR